MLAVVRENVDKGVARLPRCCELARVVPIRPKTTAAAEEDVDLSRDANRQAARARGERSRVVRFGDEVQVIVLHAEVEDAERSRPRAAPRARRPRAAAPRQERPGGCLAHSGDLVFEDAAHDRDRTGVGAVDAEVRQALREERLSP